MDANGNVQGDTSIAVDASGNVHISYFGNDKLKYVTNATGTWTIDTIDSNTSSSWYTKFTSIALDTSGKAHISYNTASFGLKYATNSGQPTFTPTPTATISPTPTPVSSATPTPFTVCEAEAITVSPSGTLKLKRGKSADVTIMVTGVDNCQVEGEIVTAVMNLAGRKRVSIVPASQTANENGQVTFTITALKKAGNARITFQAGSVKKVLAIKVLK